VLQTRIVGAPLAAPNPIHQIKEKDQTKKQGAASSAPTWQFVTRGFVEYLCVADLL